MSDAPIVEPSGEVSRYPRTRLPKSHKPKKAPVVTDSSSPRLVSLDAYRGLIMMALAASGFGIAQLARLPESAPIWTVFDYKIWQQIGFHFTHPEWASDFQTMGVAFWDLIQPAFMFMVGVSMPYSYSRREEQGSSGPGMFFHAVCRAVILVLLGVFLQSQNTDKTNWVFVNVLSQIGLGYVFLYLCLRRKFVVQLIIFVLILGGYWGYFKTYTPAEDYDYASVSAAPATVYEGNFASWSKNANAAHEFDVWFLNQFPQPGDSDFTHNGGGYLTLNFVPSIATMLLGLMAGQLLRTPRSWWKKTGSLILAGGVCMGLAILAGEFACPIVKRIWTPSWVLFSGAYVLWMLAVFYFLFDVLPFRWLAFPLAIVGMNSIAMYLMGQMMRPWTIRVVRTHFAETIETVANVPLFDHQWYGHIAYPTAAFLVFWLIALWLYRNRYFIRI